MTATLRPQNLIKPHDKVKELVSKQLYDRTLRFYKDDIHTSPLQASTATLPSVVKATTFSQSLRFGLQIRCVAIKSGSDSDTVVSNSFISMYAKFLDTVSARKVFDEMPERDSITYSSMVNCYMQKADLMMAVEILKGMYFNGFVPKPELIAAVLSVCANKGSRLIGRAIHALFIIDGRIDESVYVPTALVNMYLKCRDSSTALSVFTRMEVKNEISWTAMINGCIADCEYNKGVDCFRKMQSEGVKPNRVTLISLLSGIAESGSFRQGNEILGFAFRHEFDTDHHFSAALIKLYSRFRNRVYYARRIFERSEVKDVVMWSLIIEIYAQSSDFSEAMNHFNHMREERIQPNSVTLLAVVSACTHLASSHYAAGVHGYIEKYGLRFNAFIGNALVNMYSKCGCVAASRQAFDELAVKDVVSWSCLISGYGINGQGEEALKLYYEASQKIKTDETTFLAALSACNHSGLVEEGKILFNEVLKDRTMACTMEHYACYIDLLGRSGNVKDACEVVRKMPMKPSAKILSSLVSACKIHGNSHLAETLVKELIETEPDNPANHTLWSMIHADCGNWFSAQEKRTAMRMKGLCKYPGFSRSELST